MKKWWIIFLVSMKVSGQANDIQLFEEKLNAAWEFIFVDPHAALKQLTELRLEAIHYPDSQLAFAYNSLAVCHSVLGNNMEAIEMIDSAIVVSGTSPKAINLWLNKSMIYINTGNFLKALEILHETKVQAQAQEDYRALQTVYEELGTIYSEYGDYQRSLEMLIKSKELNSKIPETDLKASIVNKQKMGNLYLKLGKYSIAKKLIGEAIVELKENQFHDAYYTAYIGYCDALFKLKEYETLDSLLTELLPKVVEFGSQKLHAYFLTVQANYLIEIDKPTQAQASFEHAYNIYTNPSYSGFHPSLFVQYLSSLQKQGAIKKALALYEKHQDDLNNVEQNIKDRLYYHSVFFAIFRDSGNLEQALAQLVAKDKLQDSIAALDLDLFDASSIQSLESYYEEKIVESTVQTERLLLFNTRLQIALFVLGVVTLLVSSLFLILGSTWKRKLSKVNKELQTWKKKHQEAASLVDQFIKEEGTASTQVMSNSVRFFGTQPLTELAEEERLELQHQLLTKQKKRIAKLKDEFVNLSAGDLLFCALLLENYSAKEISKVLDINQKSVATKKMRLAKKLELDSVLGLKTYLSAL